MSNSTLVTQEFTGSHGKSLLNWKEDFTEMHEAGTTASLSFCNYKILPQKGRSLSQNRSSAPQEIGTIARTQTSTSVTNYCHYFVVIEKLVGFF